MSGLNTTVSNQNYTAEQEAIDDTRWDKTLNAPKNQATLQDIAQEIRLQAMRGEFGSFDSWEVLQPTKQETVK